MALDYYCVMADTIDGIPHAFGEYNNVYYFEIQVHIFTLIQPDAKTFFYLSHGVGTQISTFATDGPAAAY